jgi:TusA-related sulfurtransferase
VRVLTTDPNSQQDIRRYCERSGQNLLATWQDAQTFGFDIQKML